MDRQERETGHTRAEAEQLSTAGWLDAHYEACRTEYEQMARAVPFEAGSHLLDAGCGAGSYLPLLAELVGADGQLTAVDLAAENVEQLRQRLLTWKLPCPVTCRVAPLTSLPFPDDTFDGAWCANVIQYLEDEALLVALNELKRVVRPGGLVAVKDVDMTLLRFYPADPFLVSHLSEVSVQGPHATTQSRGSLRGRTLRRWLERAGLRDVWQKSFLIERWAPLTPVERDFFGTWLAYLATLAEERGVPEEDLVTWRRLQEPAAAGWLLDHPDFYLCEGQSLAVGRVPGGGG